jgi:hypothetical protein
MLTAKLTPFAIKTILETVFVPEPHGITQFPESLKSHGLPGPLEGSNPDEWARYWKRVMENPSPTPLKNSQ